MPRTKPHHLRRHVEDQPGVLNRVASLFRRRALQHRVADRRPHRAPGRLAHDDRGRHRRGGRAAASRRTSTSWSNVIARRGHHRVPGGDRDLAMIKVATTQASPRRDHAAGRRVPRARRRRRARVADRRDHRQPRTRSTACSRCCVRTASSRWPAPAAWRWRAARATARSPAEAGTSAPIRPTTTISLFGLVTVAARASAVATIHDRPGDTQWRRCTTTTTRISR